MDKGQIIDDLLFPSDQQTPCAVRPGMTALHDPTPSALPGATLGMHFAFTGDVRNIAEASCESLRGTTAVKRFVDCNRCPPIYRNASMTVLLARTRRRIWPSTLTGSFPICRERASSRSPWQLACPCDPFAGRVSLRLLQRKAVLLEGVQYHNAWARRCHIKRKR